MKKLTLEELTKTRFTTEFTYGGNCCIDGIENIAIPEVNAPTYVGPAIDKLKLYEDLNDQGLLVILPNKKIAIECDADEAAKADEQYIDWLENMLVMLSGNFMDLIKSLKDIDEEALKYIPLPNLNETRRAIRLIAENAEVSNNHLKPEEIDAFTNKVTTKHAKKTDEDYIKELESLIENGYTVMYHGCILDTAKINIGNYEVAVVHQERTIYATPKAIYKKIMGR